jgi:hypothetical protein
VLEENTDVTNERAGFRRCDIPSEQQIAWLREFPHDSIPHVTLPCWWFKDPEAIHLQAAFQVTRPRIQVITGSSFHLTREVRAVEVDAERMLDDDSYGTQAVTARER